MASRKSLYAMCPHSKTIYLNKQGDDGDAVGLPNRLVDAAEQRGVPVDQMELRREHSVTQHPSGKPGTQNPRGVQYRRTTVSPNRLLPQAKFSVRVSLLLSSSGRLKVPHLMSCRSLNPECGWQGSKTTGLDKRLLVGRMEAGCVCLVVER